MMGKRLVGPEYYLVVESGHTICAMCGRNETACGNDPRCVRTTFEDDDDILQDPDTFRLTCRVCGNSPAICFFRNCPRVVTNELS